MQLLAIDISDQHGVLGGHSAERQLWCAVLGRALSDALDPRADAPGASEQLRLRADARAWFNGNGQDFRGACEGAGYDPDTLRGRVLTMFAKNADANAA